jgi:signal transduction histidine kinase
MFPIPSAQRSSAERFRLPRTLSLPEMWGYGFVGGPVGWLGLISAIHLALGPAAIWVWIPSTIVGVLINSQVKRLAEKALDVAGGTPNYLARLFRHYPTIARYGAIGYLLNWIAAYALSASQLGDLINSNLPLLQDTVPLWAYKVLFMLLPLGVALSGIRALSILHLFIASTALVSMLAFVTQGWGWLIASPTSPGLWPTEWPALGFKDWAKWFFLLSYATYSGETTATFLADSRSPRKALRILDATSVLMVIVFVGASWIVSRAVPMAGLKEDVFVILGKAAEPFWGQYALLGVTIMIATSAMLVQASALAVGSRVVYQLAKDDFLAPVFQVLSRRGVFVPALVLTFSVSCFYLWWGQYNLTQLVVAGNTAWFAAYLLFYGGLWMGRRRAAVMVPGLALGLFGLQVVVLWVGGSQWGLRDVMVGLLCPFTVMAIDKLVRSSRWPLFQPDWWQQKYLLGDAQAGNRDIVTQQVVVLIGLMGGALLLGWGLRHVSILSVQSDVAAWNALVVVGLAVIVLGTAIACWTIIPSVMALSEAKQGADQLLENAQDGILVVNYLGTIQRFNPTARRFLFDGDRSSPLNSHISQWIPELVGGVMDWPGQVEIELSGQTLQVTISKPTEQSFGASVVILHDVSDRIRIESLLRDSEAQALTKAEKLAAQLLQSEKMSSLGQMVAGLAHEINNPNSFIQGNLVYVNQYTEQLLMLLKMYQAECSGLSPELAEAIEETDLDFIEADLPKVLQSITTGSHRIRDLIVSLRSFSRLDESGWKAVSIHEGIESALLLLQHRLTGSDHHGELRFVKCYGELPLVNCYAGQLNQVFMHLLKNAIDAFDGTAGLGRVPEITITTDYIQLEGEPWVRIAIADNGVGIPLEVRSRIFDPFFTTKPIGQGTGLGLSMSYQIVTQLHGGRLICESDEGVGSCFVIEIPDRFMARTEVVMVGSAIEG